jgi:hypothetical protein
MDRSRCFMYPACPEVRGCQARVFEELRALGGDSGADPTELLDDDEVKRAHGQGVEKRGCHLQLLWPPVEVPLLHLKGKRGSVVCAVGFDAVLQCDFKQVAEVAESMMAGGK